MRFDLRTPLNDPHTLMKLTSCPLVCAGRRCYATHLPATARTSSSCHHLRRRGCPMTSLHEPYAPILTPPAALVPFSGLSEPWTRAFVASPPRCDFFQPHSRPHPTPAPDWRLCVCEAVRVDATRVRTLPSLLPLVVQVILCRRMISRAELIFMLSLWDSASMCRLFACACTASRRDTRDRPAMR